MNTQQRVCFEERGCLVASPSKTKPNHKKPEFPDPLGTLELAGAWCGVAVKEERVQDVPVWPHHKLSFPRCLTTIAIAATTATKTAQTS